MGGDITVTQHPRPGQRLRIHARMGQASAPDTTHAGIFDHAATVLVVANNPLIRAHVKRLLGFWGLHCQATDCMECMGLDGKSFDLAIMDTDFRRLRLHGALLQGGSLHDAPSIVLTQLGDKSFKAGQGQVKAVLTKPLLQDELLRALAQIFGLRLYLPDNQPTEQGPCPGCGPWKSCSSTTWPPTGNWPDCCSARWGTPCTRPATAWTC
jgi:two-component system, sensor histidine kinase and response regulator